MRDTFPLVRPIVTFTPSVTDMSFYDATLLVPTEFVTLGTVYMLRIGTVLLVISKRTFLKSR